jgi:hypothetical protein
MKRTTMKGLGVIWRALRIQTCRRFCLALLLLAIAGDRRRPRGAGSPAHGRRRSRSARYLTKRDAHTANARISSAPDYIDQEEAYAIEHAEAQYVQNAAKLRIEQRT